VLIRCVLVRHVLAAYRMVTHLPTRCNFNVIILAQMFCFVKFLLGASAYFNHSANLVCCRVDRNLAINSEYALHKFLFPLFDRSGGEFNKFYKNEHIVLVYNSYFYRLDILAALSNPVIINRNLELRRSQFHLRPINRTHFHTVIWIGKVVYRRKLNRAWETLRSMPMPAIASDRLVDLHNDLTHYDTTIAQEMREYLRGNVINRHKVYIDVELEDSLRAFKAEMASEVECRRELLRYKRRIDDVVRELLRVNGRTKELQLEDEG